MLIRLKLTRDISSNPGSILYDWNNSIKNKKKYLFKKYINFIKLVTWVIKLEAPNLEKSQSSIPIKLNIKDEIEKKI
jgi:hypothetical protein